MCLTEFEKIKNDYIDKRLVERKKIVDKLKSEGYDVINSPSSGTGKHNYKK